jgi:cytochrome c biogenesis protein
MKAFDAYQSPFFFHPTGFAQRAASGLQIARSPGQNTVNAGSLVLIVGIFLLFDVSYQRLWVMTRPHADAAGTRVAMTGTSNRHQVEFRERFAHLRRWVFEQKPVAPGRDLDIHNEA